MLVPLGLPAGAPDIVITRLTPSRAASSMESSRSFAWGNPSRGKSGLPLQLRAVRVRPRELNSPRYCWRASSLARSSSTGRWIGGRKPPELISTLVMPMPAMMSRASPSGLSPRQAL